MTAATTTTDATTIRFYAKTPVTEFSLHHIRMRETAFMSMRGEHWQRAMCAKRHSLRTLEHRDIPSSPGVYIWFRDDEPVYVGEARGTQGLRGRLRAHCATGIDLSRSTLRASVAVVKLAVARRVARLRPSVMTKGQIAIVNEWLAGCELAWIECSSADEAHALEKALRSEWMPSLNRI